MKIRAIIVSILILLGVSSLVIYSRAERSAGESRAITQAVKNQNTPQLIKALIGRMKQQLEVDEDNFPALIKEVEAYAATCPDSASVAVLHSMLAEMYNRYYQQNSWTIRQRTNLAGYVPEDIREWTENLFTQKIKEELTASLQPAALLQQTPINLFKQILEIGKDSEALRPTLFDFLAFRALDIQPSEAIYQQLIAFRNTQPNKQAALLDELDYQQYRYDRSAHSKARYEAALDSLMTLYGNEPYAAEICLAQLNLIETGNYPIRYSADTRDSIAAAEYALCKATIARYPAYQRIGLFKNKLASLEQSALSVSADHTVYPGKELNLKLTYTNTPNIIVSIYHSLRTPEEATSYANLPQKKKTFGTLVQQKVYTLSLDNTYSQADTTLSIRMEELGLYECVVTVPDKKVQTRQLFSVSRLAAMSRALPSGETEIYVTDYQSGKPISDATVAYYGGSYRSPQSLGAVKTDRDGLVKLPSVRQQLAYRATLANDTSSLLTTLYPVGSGRGVSEEPLRVSLFTDRGIYRPGQTVFFTGVAYDDTPNDLHTVSGKLFSVILRDANGTEVATKQFTSNTFGSFNGSFTLPKQTLGGRFTLSTNQADVSIQVEEYKRPTFALTLLPIQGEATFGNEVTIAGEAQTFSGVALPSGTVSWRILQRPFWRGGYASRAANNRQVAEGTAGLNADGSFHLSFYPEKDEIDRLFPFQTYEVIATLTDSKGETEEASLSFSVGETNILLSLPLPEQADKETFDVTPIAMTLNREKVSVGGTYSVQRLEEAKEKEVATGRFSSGTAISNHLFAQLPSGQYRIRLKASDSKGQAVTTEGEITLYGKRDKRPPVFAHIWLVQQQTSCMPGEEAEFTFGTSDKDAYVLYELFHGTRSLQRKLMKLNDENHLFKIPFHEAYGTGIVASFTFVKEGKMYTTQVPIYRKQPDRQLSIRPETFRDRLLPGSHETWKFRILDADSLAVSAEIVAGMYDASLDKIQPFSWAFPPVQFVDLTVPRFVEGGPFESSNQYDAMQLHASNVSDYSYNQLNWQGIMSFAGNSVRRGLYDGVMMMKSSMAAGVAREESVSVAQDAATTVSGPAIESEVLYGQKPDLAAQIRTNFNETSFFYPALLTNEQGEVAFSFTMPQSNTTWKLQMLAHTVDMKQGGLTKEILTSKPLMVLPNLPRFLRQGDEVTITTQVVNQSDKEITGRVRLELFDPANDQPVVCLTKSEKPFTLLADSLTTASWTITVPPTDGLIGCRILADADAGSDGEQQLIPVLSDQLLITESTPFFLMGVGDQHIQLPGMQSSNPFRLTLELSSNPIWYAVQALPTITQPENENILSWFASYYSNTLASYIVKAHPRLQQVISRWTAQGGNASTLLSNLEKNVELKNILLEETPWVLAADNETEQKQRLATLFDLNRAAQQREAALQQLLQQQKEDGGWSWFKGFHSSRAMTLSILQGMSQLTELNAIEYSQAEKEMQIRALNFLDKSILSDYESAQKMKLWSNSEPSPEQIAYLYVRSSYRDIPELGAAREAIRHYTAQAEKFWSKQSLYSKGEIALLMQRNGKKEVAAQILAWLQKTATTSDEKGMYWANSRRGSDYFTSPIDTHCLLMSVFNELAPNTTEADRLKQWLLNQKRTQNWESVPATLNAIYALLLTGSDWLNEANTCAVKWGTHTFDTTTDGEAATGYIKVVMDRDDITPAMRTLSVHKAGKAPAWGAVYNQYFQAIDKVEKQSGVLTVEKKLFIESNSGTGLQISPITPDRPLRIGDKVIVRLTIRTDREMDYVSLKDLRAGCFEPASQLSGSEYRDGVWFYRSPEDVSENFFFSRLPQGTFVLEYAVYVSRSGDYAGGISTIQCMYAPEFVSHTEGGRIKVGE